MTTKKRIVQYLRVERYPKLLTMRLQLADFEFVRRQDKDWHRTCSATSEFGNRTQYSKGGGKNEQA